MKLAITLMSMAATLTAAFGVPAYLAWLSFGWPGGLAAVVFVGANSAAMQGLSKTLDRENKMRAALGQGTR